MTYKVYKHSSMGFCVMLRRTSFWQQVSQWYTTFGRLNYYWSQKNGFKFRDINEEIEM